MTMEKKHYIDPQLKVIKIQTQQMLATSVTDLNELDTNITTTDEFNFIPTDGDVLPSDPGDANIFL